VTALDLEHLGLGGAIAAYFLEHPEPALVDPGPSTTLEALEGGLLRLGVALEDLRHLFLTHVHLDHAGAAGHLVARNRHLTVHVHEDGAPHIVDPERLVASTRRTFGDDHDRLWGDVLSVPRDRIRAWRPGDSPPLRGIRPVSTPGHISHHLAYEAERDAVLFAGDSLGIVLSPHAPTHPATPPPGVHLADWRTTLTETLADVEVEAAAVTHFGLHSDLPGRRRQMLDALDSLEARVRHAMDEGPAAEEADRDAFVQESIESAAQGLSLERAEVYFSTFSPRSDWDGMRFHLDRTGRGTR
jgi:glyoxylase-like metal-dependent hydrolase (beta-lactamase superfamily II)